MSVAIGLRFLAGRYHATPWDHQVNEGVVEWPPAPWRLLRALVAASFKVPEPPPRETLEAVVEALSRQPPSYALPPWSAAHTRHYMPINGGKTTKIFDAFLALGSGAGDPGAEVVITWPEVSLTEAQRSALQRLCEGIGYLGRAESWVDARVLEDAPGAVQAVPANDPDQRATTRLLSPMTPDELEDFARTAPEVKKWKPPKTVLEALEVDVGELHRLGWSDVPGTRWLDYEVAEPDRRRVRKRVPRSVAPRVARYALSAPVLPSLTEALAVGEWTRKSLMSLSRDEDGGVEAVFAGHGENGGKALGQWHAWHLPEDLDGDGRIDHLVIYARDGFTGRGLEAIEALKRIWRPDQEGFEVGLTLLDKGKPADFGARPGEPTQKTGRSAVLGRGRVWRSLTPVVLPRHPKFTRQGQPRIDPKTGRQKDGPEDQVFRLLAHLDLPAPVAIERIPDGKAVGRHPWHAFRRIRPRGHGRISSPTGFGFRLVFEAPVEGPIALGYGAHLGLGLFVPVDEPGLGGAVS